jgi:uncharacterized protein YraI
VRRLLRYITIILISSVAMIAGTLPAYASTGGTIQSGGGNVNLRAGPGTGYPIVGTIGQGAGVSIDCVGYGTPVSGPFGTTNLWDEIGNREWVTDAFVNTGTSAPIAMPCATVPSLGYGSGVIVASVNPGCDYTQPGGGSNYGSMTAGPDWWPFQDGCPSSYYYTYGNGPNPSGNDYARWGYFPGAYATCDIFVYIPGQSGPKPFTNTASYQVFTNHGSPTSLGYVTINQSASVGQDVYIGAWQADGTGYLRLRLDDSSNTGNNSQIVVASQVVFDCSSEY